MRTAAMNRWSQFKVSAVLSVLLVGGFLPRSLEAQEEESYRLSREIVVPQISAEEVVVVPLDSQIYAATRSDLADLRVMRGAGQPIPFLIRPIQETTIRTIQKTWNVREPALQPLPEGGLEIQFALGDNDPQPEGIRLVTPLTDFQQQVDIEGIDGNDRFPIVQDALIFDYTRFMDVSRTSIPLPENHFRKYRIVIDKITSDQESELLEMTRTINAQLDASQTLQSTIQRRPFRMDRIELQTHTAEQEVRGDRLVEWPPQTFKVGQTDLSSETAVTLTTRTEPVTEFRITTSSLNFSRRVRVQIPVESGFPGTWSDVHSASIFRFHLRDLHQESLTISVPELRQKEVRLVVENQDSPPIEIQGVDVFGRQHEVVFLAAPEVAFQLQYGADRPRVAQHDTAVLTEAFRRGLEPVAARLGPESVITAAPAVPPQDLKGILNSKVFLSSVVGILILIFGWGLFHASRRVARLPDDEPGR